MKKANIITLIVMLTLLGCGYTVLYKESPKPRRGNSAPRTQDEFIVEPNLLRCIKSYEAKLALNATEEEAFEEFLSDTNVTPFKTGVIMVKLTVGNDSVEARRMVISSGGSVGSTFQIEGKTIMFCQVSLTIIPSLASLPTMEWISSLRRKKEERYLIPLGKGNSLQDTGFSSCLPNGVRSIDGISQIACLSEVVPCQNKRNGADWQ